MTAEELIRRLQERGDAKRLLELLPKLYKGARDRLKAILLARRPLPIAEAQAVVAGPNGPAAGVAAHLLGRAGPAEAKNAGPAVASALARWWGEWDKGRKEEARRGAAAGTLTGTLLDALTSLAWAAGRLGVAQETLVTMASMRADVPFDRPLRLAAAAALAEQKPAGKVLAALDELSAGGDAEIRTLAAEAVARASPAQIPSLAGKALSDRVTFNRLAARGGDAVRDTLRGAAVQVHNQGIVVPLMARRDDVAGLAAVAANRGFSEETRLGAVEGLAAAATEPAEAELVRIGQTLDQPEELRKAAWRGLRRSKRARKKAAQRAAAEAAK
jgi:ParB family chromosome partitioning protein